MSSSQINQTDTSRSVLKKKEKKEKKKIPFRMFAGSIDIPDRIVIYYHNKIDFSAIDFTIQHKYNILKKHLPDMIKKYEKNMKKIELESDRLEYSSILQIKEDTTRMIMEINDYKNDTSLKNYLEESKHILSILKTKENYDSDMVEDYFSICRKHIKIDLIKNIEEEIKCVGCGGPLSEPTHIEMVVVCPNCDTINPSMKPSKYTRDIEFGNTVYDEDIMNFIKVLDKFEGKNTCPIHPELYEELDGYMENLNMKPGAYYRNLPINKNGKKDGTSKRILWQALESLGYNQYYEEASRICHIYWGWTLPDLSFYRDKLIEDYQNTQCVWNMIKGDFKRSASLGTQYRLYVQLMAVGYECDREDFRIQEMVDSLRLHNQAWSRMCKETGVPYHPISS